MKYSIKSIFFLLIMVPFLQSWAELKTFGDIESPVYRSTSHGGQGYGGNYQFVSLKTPPSVEGQRYFLPNSQERLSWKYSVHLKRDGRIENGVCYITTFGSLRIETESIQLGDICLVTVTVSHPSYRDKSVFVEVHWYGPQNIQTIPYTPPQIFKDVTPPIYESTSREGEGYGDYQFIYLQSPPSVGGHTYFLPDNKRPLKWTFSTHLKQDNHTSDSVCHISGFGVLRIELKNIQLGDICVVTATVSHPSYEDKSVSVEVHWYGPQDILTLPHAL